MISKGLAFQAHAHDNGGMKVREVARVFLLWYLRWLIWSVRLTQKALRRLGIPTLPPPKTERQLMWRAIMLWIVLAAIYAPAFYLLGLVK